MSNTYTQDQAPETPIFDSMAFRQALGSFATGVTIITTVDIEGRNVGLTASSFNSVSLDPPLVLWSLAKTSKAIDAFNQSELFAVHVLHAGQQELSNQFSKSGEDKFAGVQVTRGPGGVPLLAECGSRFDCRTAYRYDGGDHIIFVGEVLNFVHSAEAPLVFHGGRYAIASPHSDTEDREASQFYDLGHLVARTYYQLLTPVRILAEQHQLSLPAQNALSVLYSEPGLTTEDLDNIISYTGVRITSDIAAQLGERGLVAEKNGKLHLTSAGRQVIVEVIAAAKAVEADVLNSFSEEESRLLKRFLRRMVRSTQKFDQRVERHHDILGRLAKSH